MTDASRFHMISLELFSAPAPNLYQKHSGIPGVAKKNLKISSMVPMQGRTVLRFSLQICELSPEFFARNSPPEQPKSLSLRLAENVQHSVGKKPAKQQICDAFWCKNHARSDRNFAFQSSRPWSKLEVEKSLEKQCGRWFDDRTQMHGFLMALCIENRWLLWVTYFSETFLTKSKVDSHSPTNSSIVQEKVVHTVKFTFHWSSPPPL